MTLFQYFVVWLVAFFSFLSVLVGWFGFAESKRKIRNWRKLLFWRKSKCDHATGDRHNATFRDVSVMPITGRYAGVAVLLSQAEHHECINCGATWWVFKENDVESIHG